MIKPIQRILLTVAALCCASTLALARATASTPTTKTTQLTPTYGQSLATPQQTTAATPKAKPAKQAKAAASSDYFADVVHTYEKGTRLYCETIAQALSGSALSEYVK